MKPAEFQQQLDRLEWNTDNFCRMAEVAPATVRCWLSGATPVPHWVEPFFSTASDLKQLSSLIDRRSSRNPSALQGLSVSLA